MAAAGKIARLKQVRAKTVAAGIFLLLGAGCAARDSSQIAFRSAYAQLIQEMAELRACPGQPMPAAALAQLRLRERRFLEIRRFAGSSGRAADLEETERRFGPQTATGGCVGPDPALSHALTEFDRAAQEVVEIAFRMRRSS